MRDNITVFMLKINIGFQYLVYNVLWVLDRSEENKLNKVKLIYAIIERLLRKSVGLINDMALFYLHSYSVHLHSVYLYLYIFIAFIFIVMAFITS